DNTEIFNKILIIASKVDLDDFKKLLELIPNEFVANDEISLLVILFMNNFSSIKLFTKYLNLDIIKYENIYFDLYFNYKSSYGPKALNNFKEDINILINNDNNTYEIFIDGGIAILKKIYMCRYIKC